MGFISFAILGIIAAVIAKLILRQKVGWFLTFVLGILGAMVGGWISASSSRTSTEPTASGRSPRGGSPSRALSSCS